jgi:hypothetical protein
MAAAMAGFEGVGGRADATLIPAEPAGPIVAPEGVTVVMLSSPSLPPARDNEELMLA